MKTALQILGVFIIIFSGIIILVSLSTLSHGSLNDDSYKIILYSVFGIIIGIVMIAGSSEMKSSTKKFDMQEYEEFKRYQEQQRQIYYRNANAQGKPISEYLMDDRTKLITYYDRMPQDYKSQLVNYADMLYRKYENQEYLNRK